MSAPMIRSNWESGYPEQTRFGEGAKQLQPWTCAHGHDNARFAANCFTPECREKRPK